MTKKQVGAGYDPTVSVITRKEGNQILISIQDNGNGIPQKAADKIFQPFFTTKPTGQGTGLGLSLSYDIMKAHGGSCGWKPGKVKARFPGSSYRVPASFLIDYKFILKTLIPYVNDTPDFRRLF